MLLDAVVGGPHDCETCPHFDEVDGSIEERAVSTFGEYFRIQSVDGEEIEGVYKSKDAAIEPSCYEISFEVPEVVFEFVHNKYGCEECFAFGVTLYYRF